MSAAEEVIKAEQLREVSQTPVLNRFLDLLSSVRFGIVLLCALVVLSIVGMLIMQQEVDGFEAYYASLLPAEKLVGGALGIFDIYHSWYYNFLLLTLSLNIVLASIDRFPSAWSYIVKPKLDASRHWLLNRRNQFGMKADNGDPSAIASAISGIFSKNGFRTRMTEKHGVLYVFGQRGKWNRVGAYIVHVFLLILFMGHFVAFQTGRNADVRMVPGEKTNQIQDIRYDLDKKIRFNVQVPFTLECTDIQQRLIDPEGGIDITNTLDWRTQVRIDDPDYGVNTYDVSLNKPLSYRGYRFFQAQTDGFGSARSIKLDLIPQNGGENVPIELPRNGSTSLADGTKVEYEAFLPDFFLNEKGQPDSRSGDYVRPAAVLKVEPPGGSPTRVFAFAAAMADNLPVGAPKAGYKWRLADFERSPNAHILSIKYDPYSASFIAWYIGGFGLVGALGFVFFLSHRRVWARIEPSTAGDASDIIIAGDTNRNQAAFDDKFERIVSSLKSPED
jgi:cytochrome c biogenesis protein